MVRCSRRPGPGVAMHIRVSEVTVRCGLRASRTNLPSTSSVLYLVLPPGFHAMTSSPPQEVAFYREQIGHSTGVPPGGIAAQAQVHSTHACACVHDAWGGGWTRCPSRRAVGRLVDLQQPICLCVFRQVREMQTANGAQELRYLHPPPAPFPHHHFDDATARGSQAGRQQDWRIPPAAREPRETGAWRPGRW